MSIFEERDKRFCQKDFYLLQLSAELIFCPQILEKYRSIFVEVTDSKSRRIMPFLK